MIFKLVEIQEEMENVVFDRYERGDLLGLLKTANPNLVYYYVNFEYNLYSDIEDLMTAILLTDVKDASEEFILETLRQMYDGVNLMECELL